MFDPQELTLFLGFQEQRDQFGYAEEADPLTLSAGSDPETRREVRLAGPTGPDQEDVLALVELAKELILDLDSSVRETYGKQEGTAYNGHFECTCYHLLFLFNQCGNLDSTS